MGDLASVLDPVGSHAPDPLGLGRDLLSPVYMTLDTFGFTKASKATPGTQGVDNQQTVSIQATQANCNIVYGQQRVGGTFAFYGLSGANNDTLWFVVAVACHQVAGMSDLIIDGTLIPAASIDGSGNVTSGKYAGLVQVFYHLGTGSQAVDANINAAFTEWTSSFTGLDVAYFIVKLTQDATAFPSVPQQFAVSVTGKPVYDPRLDSTNGGSGPQRAATRSTWAWSSNAVLCTRDYLTDSQNYGCCGFPNSIIDDSVTIASANTADETVTYTVGGVDTQQVRYAINGVLTTGQDYASNLLLLTTAMNGRVDEVSGKYHVKAGVYETPADTIDHTWLRKGASIATGPDLGNLYNAVRGQFTDSQQNYQQVPFHPYTNSSYATADGGTFWKDIDLSMLSDQYMAQRVATLYGRQSRNQQTIVFPMDHRGLKYALGDAFTLTIPRDVGAGDFYCNAKVMRVVAITLVLTGAEIGFDFALCEDSSTAHSWSKTDAFTVTIPVAPGTATQAPPAPTSCTIDSAPDGVYVECVPPPPDQYSFIEVWTNTVNTFSGATFRGQFRDTHFLYKDKTQPTYYFFLRAKNLQKQYSSVVAIGSLTGGWSSDQLALEKQLYLDVRTRANFTLLAGAAAAWYAVATIPGEGAGVTGGEFELRVGFYNVTDVRCGYFFLCGITTTGGCGMKMVFNHQSSIAVFNQWRFRQNQAGDGTLIVEFNLTGTTHDLPVVVDVIPTPGTYAQKPVASNGAIGSTAGFVTALGPYNFVIGTSGVMHAHYSDSAAQVELTRDGQHYVYGNNLINTNGMLASQLRNRSLVGPGFANTYWTGITFTPHPTSMNVSAGTLHLGDDTVSYSATSKTGLANSTTYSFYYVDANLSGGANTLNATTSKQTLIANNNNVYIGDGTTQSGGGTGGGGGTGSCISAQMLLGPKLRARFARLGDWLDCADEFQPMGRLKIHALHFTCEPCVRLVADNGAALVCSTSTPFTLPDGTTALAPDMQGKAVLTDKGQAVITSVSEQGSLPVAHISCNSKSYAAGEDGALRIYSHNNQKP